MADATQGDTAQAVIHQLPVAEAETQQDPIDLVLSRGLFGGGNSEWLLWSPAPQGDCPQCASVTPLKGDSPTTPSKVEGTRESTCQRMSTEVVVCGVTERMVGASSGAVGRRGQ